MIVQQKNLVKYYFKIMHTYLYNIVYKFSIKKHNYFVYFIIKKFFIL